MRKSLAIEKADQLAALSQENFYVFHRVIGNENPEEAYHLVPQSGLDMINRHGLSITMVYCAQVTK